MITFPKEIRVQENITDGEVLNMIKLSGDVYVISRRSSRVDRAAEQLAEKWIESGESLESNLSMLREVREEYDRYG